VTAAGAADRVSHKSAAFALYLVLTLALAWPLTFNPGSRVVAGGPDTELYMWTLAWDTYALLHRPLSMFDANIYHPQRLTLAYSENLIGSAFFAAPVLWLTDNPVLALNAVALLSCALCGLGAYILGRRVGLGVPGALICGLIFAFSPPRFFRITQLHLTTVQWVPFALASLHAYLDRGRRRDLHLAAAFFTLQALTSGHGAVFLLVGAACIVGYRVLTGEMVGARRLIRDAGIPALLLLLPAAALIVPYRIVQSEMGLRRGLFDWAASPESFLASPASLHVWVLSLFQAAHINENASAFLFPGYLPIILATVAAIGLWKREGLRERTAAVPGGTWARLAVLLNILVLLSLAIGVAVALAGSVRLRTGGMLLFSARDPIRAFLVSGVCLILRIVLLRKAPFTVMARARGLRGAFLQWRGGRRRDITVLYAFMTLVSLGLAVGPPLSLWPLVYWLPGMNFIRGPSRFMLLAVLGLAVLSGLGFERLRGRLGPPGRPALAAGVAALLLIEFAALPLPTIPYRVDIPGVDRWIDTRPKPSVVVELPLLHSEALHTRYMLHSTAHWQTLVNGYSGLRPPLHEKLFNRLRGFPDEFTVNSLMDLGVTYVVIHTDLYPPGEWTTVSERLKAFPGVFRLEHSEGPGLVYSVHAKP
jgi:hypothetical protein